MGNSNGDIVKMAEITLESLEKKLGFDPLNPPYPEVDPWAINDNRPSLWAPLTEEELAFLIRVTTGIDVYELENGSQSNR